MGNNEMFMSLELNIVIIYTAEYIEIIVNVIYFI